MPTLILWPVSCSLYFNWLQLIGDVFGWLGFPRIERRKNGLGGRWTRINGDIIIGKCGIPSTDMRTDKTRMERQKERERRKERENEK